VKFLELMDNKELLGFIGVIVFVVIIVVALVV
jgi:hypothetical protein